MKNLKPLVYPLRLLVQVSNTVICFDLLLRLKKYELFKMKKILIIITLLLVLGSAQAQKVYSVKYESQADVKIFVVKYESQADLKVYKVKYESQAGDNDGKWFFVDYENKAKNKVFFVDYESKADLKIFFVEYESKAGWNNNSKKHLMY